MMYRLRSVIAALIFTLAASSASYALDVKLLWQKEMPSRIDYIRMAYGIGDVILNIKEARQIILFDNKGNIRFQWGPRIDRVPIDVTINDDGSAISYVTAWSEDYIEEHGIRVSEVGDDWRIHYVDNKGNEKWNVIFQGGGLQFRQTENS